MQSLPRRRLPALLSLAALLAVAACSDSPTAGAGAGEPDAGRKPKAPVPAPTPTTSDRPFYAGAYLGSAESSPEAIDAALASFTALTGKRPALVKSFHSLRSDYGATGWVGQLLRKVAAAGSTPYVALDPRWATAPTTGLLEAIAAGQADADLARVARGIASMGTTVLVEPAWEMNGNWSYSWQGVENGGDGAAPARYVEAWRRIVTVFRREGATNVRWVFNPNVGNPLTHRATGSTHWNWYANYYPGDTYVDYVGAHGFNAPRLWGGSWQDWGTMLDGAAADHMLSDLAARYPGKPIIIGEMASDEGAGDAKGAWIRDAYARMRAHPSVVGAVWFHANKETNWRVDSSPAALAAYREAVADPRVQTAFAPVAAASYALASR